MDECIEYRKNIKKIVLKKYEKELDMLQPKNVYITFYDKVKSQNMKDNYILITDFKNLEESLKKTYYYLGLLERKYVILDIFIFKMKDTINYNDGFLASFFCVEKNLYELEREKYNKIFKKNIKNVEKIKESIKRYVETKKKYLVEINNMNEFQSDISEIYQDIVKNTIVCQEKQR